MQLYLPDSNSTPKTGGKVSASTPLSQLYATLVHRVLLMVDIRHMHRVEVIIICAELLHIVQRVRQALQIAAPEINLMAPDTRALR